jgi:hypothetical protein
VAQFRVEFVLDEASGKYLAELYNPENHAELIARTEAMYATQAQAVLGLVQLFKDAVLKFPPPLKAVKKTAKKKAPKKKAAKRKTPTRRRKKKGTLCCWPRRLPRRRRSPISTTPSRSTPRSPARRRAAIRAPWSRA